MSDEAVHPGSAAMREHLANERTLLAYIRTGITLTSFGITLNRFAVFLAQLHLGHGEVEWARSVAHLDRMGFGMGVLGVGLLVWAAVNFRQVGRAIDRGAVRPRQTLVWVLATLVIALSMTGIGVLVFS